MEDPEAATTYEVCRACGGRLFRKNRLPDGVWAMDPQELLKLERDHGDLFFVCPHCEAENLVERSSSDSRGTVLNLIGIRNRET
jgi:DNA-directed RNA polymerase subunit RPC12/RpoP